MDEWRKLGQHTVQESQVVLGTASGDNLGAVGKVHARDFLEGQHVELEATLVTKVKKCLLSGVKLRESGYLLTLSSNGSYVEKHGHKMNLTCTGTVRK